jgi:hypothetical protein
MPPNSGLRLGVLLGSGTGEGEDQEEQGQEQDVEMDMDEDGDDGSTAHGHGLGPGSGGLPRERVVLPRLPRGGGIHARSKGALVRVIRQPACTRADPGDMARTGG